jgi:hypothetical protein
MHAHMLIFGHTCTTIRTCMFMRSAVQKLCMSSQYVHAEPQSSGGGGVVCCMLLRRAEVVHACIHAIFMFLPRAKVAHAAFSCSCSTLSCSIHADVHAACSYLCSCSGQDSYVQLHAASCSCSCSRQESYILLYVLFLYSAEVAHVLTICAC